MCVELGEELLGHLVDLIAEDALLRGGVSAANAGERRLPGTVEGLRRTVGPQVTTSNRVQTRQPEVRAPWTHVQPACHALLRELAMLPALSQTRACCDVAHVKGVAPTSLEERLLNLALSLRWHIAAVERHLASCSCLTHVRTRFRLTSSRRLPRVGTTRTR